MNRRRGLLRPAIAAGVLAAAACLGLAQVRAQVLAQAPWPPSAGSTAAPVSPSAGGKPPPFQMRTGPVVPDAPERPGPEAAPAAAATAALNAPVDRPILSAPDINLTGENDSVSETVYLSATEAGRSATFSVGVLSSVVVMPEASRLTVSINGEPVMAEPITSAGRARRFQARLPAGVLRAGANRVRIAVEQRHRVDCSVEATFELWSLLQPAITGFNFEGGAVALSSLADLPTIGVDDTGATRLTVLGPLHGGPIGIRFATVSGITSAAAVLGRFSHPVVEAAGAQAPERRSPGRFAIVVGTAAAVLPFTTVGAVEALRGPAVAFASDPVTGVPMLVVSGPTPADVQTAVERLAALATQVTYPGETGGRWRFPEAAVFDGGEARTFAELGLPTEEFSGRRFAERFEFLLPADFYSADSGSAHLLLDAAFAPGVDAGSAINIRVNGQVSVSLRLAAGGGVLFDKRRVKLPMEFFRPGLNRIELEAVLDTRADRECTPGLSAGREDRFVLFESSVFEVPTFARFGNWPNLAAFAADAFPFDVRAGRPLGVYLGGSSMPAAVAATLLARLSVDTGSPIAGEIIPDVDGLANRPALVVGTAGDVPEVVKTATGLSHILDGEWRLTTGTTMPATAADDTGAFAEAVRRLEAMQPAVGATAPAGPAIDIGNPERTRALYDQWRRQVGEEASGDMLQWLLQRFRDATAVFLPDVTTGRVRLTSRTRLVIAQAPASPPTWRSAIWPSTAPAAWTLVTAPDDAALASATAAMTAPANWQRLAGGVVTYDDATGIVSAFDPAVTVDVATRPFSISNVRLTAANWFSIPIAGDGWAGVGLALCVGASSWMFIHRVGRRADP